MASPRLSLYVRDIHLVGDIDINSLGVNHDRELFFTEVIPSILEQFKCVRRISLVYLANGQKGRGFLRKKNWTDQPEPLKNAILNLCLNPSVIGMTISHIRDFPVSILASCSRLKKLSLRELDFVTYNHQNIDVDMRKLEASQPQGNLDTLEMDRSFNTFFPVVVQAFQHPHSVVSLSQLCALRIVGSLPETTDAVWENIDIFARALKCLMWNQAVDWEGRTGTNRLRHWMVTPIYAAASPVISKFYAEPLNLARMINLRYLVLTFLADVNKYGIIPNLDWLADSLIHLRWCNHIEEITVVLIYESWNRDNTNALLSVWTRRLDAVIAGRGFPALKCIRIVLPDFADRVKRFIVEIKPQLGLQVGEYFHIEPLRNDTVNIWRETTEKILWRTRGS